MTYRGFLFLTINCDSAWGSRDGVSEVSFVLGVGVGDFFFDVGSGERENWVRDTDFGWVLSSFFGGEIVQMAKGGRRFVGEVRTLHGLGPCSWYPIASSMLLACLFFSFLGLVHLWGGWGRFSACFGIPPFPTTFQSPSTLSFGVFDTGDDGSLFMDILIISGGAGKWSGLLRIWKFLSRENYQQMSGLTTMPTRLTRWLIIAFRQFQPKLGKPLNDFFSPTNHQVKGSFNHISARLYFYNFVVSY